MEIDSPGEIDTSFTDASEVSGFSNTPIVVTDPKIPETSDGTVEGDLSICFDGPFEAGVPKALTFGYVIAGCSVTPLHSNFSYLIKSSGRNIFISLDVGGIRTPGSTVINNNSIKTLANHQGCGHSSPRSLKTQTKQFSTPEGLNWYFVFKDSLPAAMLERNRMFPQAASFKDVDIVLPAQSELGGASNTTLSSLTKNSKTPLHKQGALEPKILVIHIPNHNRETVKYVRKIVERLTHLKSSKVDNNSFSLQFETHTQAVEFQQKLEERMKTTRHKVAFSFKAKFDSYSNGRRHKAKELCIIHFVKTRARPGALHKVVERLTGLHECASFYDMANKDRLVFKFTSIPDILTGAIFRAQTVRHNHPTFKGVPFMFPNKNNTCMQCNYPGHLESQCSYLFQQMANLHGMGFRNKMTRLAEPSAMYITARDRQEHLNHLNCGLKPSVITVVSKKTTKDGCHETVRVFFTQPSASDPSRHMPFIKTVVPKIRTEISSNPLSNGENVDFVKGAAQKMFKTNDTLAALRIFCSTSESSLLEKTPEQLRGLARTARAMTETHHLESRDPFPSRSTPAGEFEDVKVFKSSNFQDLLLCKNWTATAKSEEKALLLTEIFLSTLALSFRFRLLQKKNIDQDKLSSLLQKPSNVGTVVSVLDVSRHSFKRRFFVFIGNHFNVKPVERSQLL